VRMLDLFAGRFGWSKAFAARGWECVGVDLVEPPGIPHGCRFIQMNILDLHALGPKWSLHIDCSPCQGTGNFYRHDEDGDYLPCDNCEGSGVIAEPAEFDFICASSPCEQFSVHGMKHFHPNPPYPELGINLFEHTRAICEASGVPYVMENVRAAQQFVGNAKHHCGPFYLWGSGVPPLLHRGIIKGWEHKYIDSKGRKRGGGPGRYEWSTSEGRREATAKVATIPPELANCVADYAERLLEQKELTR
jgi:hypothetical protein